MLPLRHRVHKNVYDKTDGGKAGKYRAKLDYEPLNLLSGNLGIFDVDEACDLVELVDQLCMDSISCGASVSFAMEYNRRHGDAPIAGGVSFGDATEAMRVIKEIAAGELPLLGQGSRRAGQELGATEYAMHCKGIEFPAYLPQTNPGYPWALAGGHMSMSTYLLLLYEKETGLDYWVDAITERGPKIMRDDLLGVCKFSGMNDANMTKAIELLAGLETTGEELQRAVRRTYLRGYAIEKAQGLRRERLRHAGRRARAQPAHRPAVLQHARVLRGAKGARDRALRRDAGRGGPLVGITAQDFPILQQAIEASPGPRMCELGAQYLQVDGVFRGVAKKYLAEHGVDHTSFDINGLHGSLVVDLCKPITDAAYVGTFDIVTNFGTSEHVVEQYTCFSNIHALCKPGGIMMHSVPPPGHWPGHGRFYYPLEFFDGLAQANGYEVLHREITAGLGNGIDPLAVVTLRKAGDPPFMDRDAFAALPVEEDTENELVGNYIGRPPPLQRLWKNTKRFFLLRAKS